MSPRIPTHAPPSFKLDATLQIVTAVVALLGGVLLLAGLALPLGERAATLTEGIRRTLIPMILRVAAGALLLIGVLQLRQGRRRGAVIVLALLALVALNALRGGLIAGIVVSIIAVVLAAPILGRLARLS
jgi:hypothetical protein